MRLVLLSRVEIMMTRRRGKTAVIPLLLGKLAMNKQARTQNCSKARTRALCVHTATLLCSRAVHQPLGTVAVNAHQQAVSQCTIPFARVGSNVTLSGIWTCTTTLAQVQTCMSKPESCQRSTNPLLRPLFPPTPFCMPCF